MREIYRHRAQMVNSYIRSIAKVGGDPEMFIDRMDTMTVQEMIDVLAQNGVRFTTTKERAPSLREMRQMRPDLFVGPKD